MRYQHEQDEKFLMVMMTLAEASAQECSDFKIKIYAKALEDMHIDQIEKAAWEIINTRTFATFPKVAEIREMIGGKSEDVATIALAEMETAMRRVGSYRSITFTDPIINATIKLMGGWVKCCLMDLDEWKFARRDFLKVYSALKARPDFERVPHLAGLIERDASARGADYPAPVVFGGEVVKMVEHSQAAIA